MSTPVSIITQTTAEELCIANNPGTHHAVGSLCYADAAARNGACTHPFHYADGAARNAACDYVLHYASEATRNAACSLVHVGQYVPSAYVPMMSAPLTVDQTTAKIQPLLLTHDHRPMNGASLGTYMTMAQTTTFQASMYWGGSTAQSEWWRKTITGRLPFPMSTATVIRFYAHMYGLDERGRKAVTTGMLVAILLAIRTVRKSVFCTVLVRGFAC
jgi:hypothetical protein